MWGDESCDKSGHQGRAEVQACKRCSIEKMGLVEKKVAPGLAKVRSGTPNLKLAMAELEKEAKT